MYSWKTISLCYVHAHFLTLDDRQACLWWLEFEICLFLDRQLKAFLCPCFCSKKLCCSVVWFRQCWIPTFGNVRLQRLCWIIDLSLVPFYEFCSEPNWYEMYFVNCKLNQNGVSWKWTRFSHVLLYEASLLYSIITNMDLKMRPEVEN